jgi:polar amino acid transport system substrate-binding protein
LKKTFIVLFIVLLAISLFGCNNTKTEEIIEVDNEESQKDTPEIIENESALEKINMVWFENIPHVFTNEEGNLDGALYNMLNNEIAPKMNVEFIWDNEGTAVPRQLERLKEDPELFAVSLLAKTPEREEISVYTEKFYYSSESCLILKKDNPLNKITKIDDILKLTIGYSKDTFLSPFMRDERINFDFVNTTESFVDINNQKVAAGRIDAAYAPDKAGLLTSMKKFNLEDELKLLTLPENSSNFYVLFSKSSEDYAKKYNEVIKDINLEELYTQYLSDYIDINLLEKINDR